jgi:uncharacterized small protein (DUF1192 family)
MSNTPETTTLPFQEAADFADAIILEKMIEIAKNKNMSNMTEEMRQYLLNSIDERKAKIQSEIDELKAKIASREDKYQSLGNNIFGFEIFEEVFKVINERGIGDQEQMFKAGVASAEAAVRRLREEYYESISNATGE